MEVVTGVVGLLGVLLGWFLNVFSERRQKREEQQAIRQALLSEIRRNTQLLYRWLEHKGAKENAEFRDTKELVHYVLSSQHSVEVYARLLERLPASLIPRVVDFYGALMMIREMALYFEPFVDDFYKNPGITGSQFKQFLGQIHGAYASGNHLCKTL